jgi:hypothetical protein
MRTPTKVSPVLAKTWNMTASTQSIRSQNRQSVAYLCGTILPSFDFECCVQHKFIFKKNRNFDQSLNVVRVVDTKVLNSQRSLLRSFLVSKVVDFFSLESPKVKATGPQAIVSV